MLTKWEHKELAKEQKIRERKLKEELVELKKPSKYSNVGASRYEMRKWESARDRKYAIKYELTNVRESRGFNKIYGT